ncbi:hypothetical protein [uncultured Desulfosarcina sp.]|uniref:hypothetical protein n=1 Tax=uncultured Desulfosarcina sp. TaxID=218289 RepID=UPI0029C689CE|nr:hypothetical protein [uncultured Desulfosarcina sp.]
MPPEKFQTLADLIQKVLDRKDVVIVCITGNKGAGKTTLGKLIRKKGFGPFGPGKIAVIDDDCMSVDTLFFFRRKFVDPCRGIDELRPFFRFCIKKPIRFYVKSNPESRITYADILLKVELPEEIRRQRLIQRYGEPKGELVFRQTQAYQNTPRITVEHELTARVQ